MQPHNCDSEGEEEIMSWQLCFPVVAGHFCCEEALFAKCHLCAGVSVCVSALACKTRRSRNLLHQRRCSAGWRKETSALKTSGAVTHISSLSQLWIYRH